MSHVKTDIISLINNNECTSHSYDERKIEKPIWQGHYEDWINNGFEDESNKKCYFREG